MRILRAFFILLVTNSCLLGATPLPQLTTISEHLNNLQAQLNNEQLSLSDKQTLQHEFHRVLFIAYLLRSERSKHESRIQAHHAFSTLYHAPCSNQHALRDLLSSFVQDLYKIRMQRISNKARSEAVLRRATELEEAVLPLLQNSPRGQDALFSFTKSIYKVMVTPRLTRAHWAGIFGIMSMLGVATWAFVMLLRQMKQSAAQMDDAIAAVQRFGETAGNFVRNDLRHVSNAVYQATTELKDNVENVTSSAITAAQATRDESGGVKGHIMRGLLDEIKKVFVQFEQNLANRLSRPAASADVAPLAEIAQPTTATPGA